jgi:hypothetical protein
MKLRLGNSAILAYRRLPYRLWYAIAEFVDNSTDAYLRGDNKNLLDEQFKKTGEVFSVEIDFDRDNKTLILLLLLILIYYYYYYYYYY